MGNFFTDPFGGSFAGRVYTKIAKSAAGDSSYSITNPEKNNPKPQSNNDRFIDFGTVDSAKKFSDGEKTTETVHDKAFYDNMARDDAKSYYSNWAKNQDRKTVEDSYNQLVAKKEKSNTTWNKIKTKLFNCNLPCGSLPEIWCPYDEGHLSALKEHLDASK